MIQLKSECDVNLVQHCGGDHMVVASAKVCTSGCSALSFQDGSAKNAKGEPWGEKDTAGLINYLMKHRHGSAFEHGSMTFFVHAPIFVWREWHRHRIGFSYNEESARYKQLEPVFYLPPHDRPMFKVDEWKPGRPKFLPILNQTGEAAYSKLCRNLQESYESAYAKYQENLSLGVDPGLARDCLPVGIFSGCWVTCNPRSMMSFLSLRVHDPAAKFVSYPLYEIDQVARKCEELFASLYPITHKAFVDNGRVAP